MPKIFGTSALGILLATIAFYMIGFLIYGVLFSEQWMSWAGITQAAADAHAAKLGPMMYIGGLLITLIQVLGLSKVLNWAGASNLMTCGKIGAMIATFIALPVMAYSYLYEGTSGNVLGLDYIHLLVGYVVACKVMSFFRD